jgi:RNA polymerase sigma-70 factor (ECF subfamily)
MVANLQRRSGTDTADFHAAITTGADRWYSVCLRITRDPQLAEDALQDALLSAWNNRHQFDGSARLGTWIHRIAVNAALQVLRRRRPGAFVALEDDLADRGPSPVALTEGTEIGERLSQALGGLSDLERVCFVLRHLEEWRLAEIADETGVTTGAVKQAVFRAVRKLRTTMANLKGDRP